MKITTRAIRRLAKFTRDLALAAAHLWAKVPSPIRQKSPYQIVRVMSLRPYKLAFSSRRVMNMGGLLTEANECTIQINNTITNTKGNPKSEFNSLLTVNTPAESITAVMGSSKNHILVIGGTDSTFPIQLDLRFQVRTSQEVAEITNAAKELKHCYVENLSSRSPEFSPIPGGLIPDFWMGTVRIVRSRPLQPAGQKLAFCAHKTRSTSDQWETRKKVTRLARGPWKEFTAVPAGRLSLKDFQNELNRHSFTLCVEGGGIDPSPKAFEALLAGSIPIIRESPLADAYRHLPVLVIPDWEEEHLSQDILEDALRKITADFPDWTVVLERLSMQYWLDLIETGRSTRALPG